MEIIKRGTPPGEKTYEATCRSCKTEVRFKRSEAKAQLDRNQPLLVVSCPVCSNSIFTNA